MKNRTTTGRLLRAPRAARRRQLLGTTQGNQSRSLRATLKRPEQGERCSNREGSTNSGAKDCDNARYSLEARSHPAHMNFVCNQLRRSLSLCAANGWAERPHL
jgi:hypothetical protein